MALAKSMKQIGTNFCFTLPRPYKGQILFVDSTYGSNLTSGLHFHDPLKSVQYALSKCVADNDDCIVVLNGYNNDTTDEETNGDDTPIDVDVDGVTILSAGRNVVVQAIGSGDSVFKIDADEVTIGALPGCCWQIAAAKAGTTSIVVEIAAGAVNSETYGFRPVPGADLDGYTKAVSISATSHGAHVHDNFFEGNTTDTDAGIVIEGTADQVRIENNHLIECCATNGQIYSASIHTNCLIKGNILDTRTASKKGINFTANATGVICNNYVYVEADADGIVNGLCAEFENYVNDAETTSAFVSPAAGSIT